MTAIYVMGTNDGPKKIGIAENPKKRLSAIRTHNAFHVDILHSRELGEDAWKVEGHAHRLLGSHHIRGEWFSVTVDDAVAAIAAAMERVANGEAIGRTVGRKKEFPNRITLPLSDEMLAGIEAARVGKEERVELIREAIDREIKRRKRAKQGKPED